MSLGHLGLGAGSAVRALVDFWLIFEEVRATIEAPFLRHRHTGNRKTAISCITFSIDFSYVFEGVKNQRICSPRCANGVKI